MSNIDYTDDFEKLIKRYGEISESMSILHHYAHLKYSKLSNYTNIPVIIITSLIGILIQLTLFPQQNIMLGLLSMLGSIMKTLDSYYDFTKRSQNHLNTSVQYSSISSYLQIQLSLERDRRVNAKDLLDIITNQLDSIKKSEPDIDEDIVAKFNNKYKNDTTSKPALVNGLTNIKITGISTPLNTPLLQTNLVIPPKLESKPEILHQITSELNEA